MQGRVKWIEDEYGRIIVPRTLASALIEDSLHQTVTLEEKAKWDGKVELKDIPKNLSELNEDDEHQLVSQTEKDNWNNKVDKKTNYSLVKNSDITQISTNKSDIEILKGKGDGSIDALINDKINEWASALTDDGTINTYAEALNWIATHASDYTALVGEVAKKVDSKSGYGLSKNDFTDILKKKLEDKYNTIINCDSNFEVKIENNSSDGNIEEKSYNISLSKENEQALSTMIGMGFSIVDGVLCQTYKGE